MKDITITLKPPITEYCPKCDYESSKSFYSHLAYCPKCGANLCSGERPLEEQSIRIVRYYGSFDWAHPSEKQYQYIFYNCPNGKKYDFVIDEEFDTSDVFDCIEEIYRIITEKYLYNFDKPKIKELYELVVKNEEIRERQELLTAKKREKELRYELYKLYYDNPELLKETNNEQRNMA